MGEIVKVRMVAGSLVISLPQSILKPLEIKAGDRLIIEPFPRENPRQLVLTKENPTMIKVRMPIKCGKCSEVTIFEMTPPAPGTQKQFQLRCSSCGNEVSSSDGNYEVVDLEKYDESKLTRVIF